MNGTQVSNGSGGQLDWCLKVLVQKLPERKIGP